MCTSFSERIAPAALNHDPRVPALIAFEVTNLGNYIISFFLLKNEENMFEVEH
jgi:hypothetical protein